MIEYAVRLEASDPERNLHRAYRVAAGRDLFGQWIVEITFGRIGARGRTQVIPVADETAARTYVEACLRKRMSAPKRIGVSSRRA